MGEGSLRQVGIGEGDQVLMGRKMGQDRVSGKSQALGRAFSGQSLQTVLGEI